MTLASSRATSHRITSPSGRRAAPSSRMMLMTEAVPVRTSMTRSVRSGGETIRRWTMRRAGYPQVRLVQDRLQLAAA